MHKFWRVLVTAAVLSGTGSASRAQWGGADHPCQILDKSSPPLYQCDIAYIPGSAFEGYDESAVMEINGQWAVAYLHDILSGDMDINAVLHGSIFFSSAEIFLPDQLMKLAIDTGWTWRKANHTALRLQAAPGFYTDMESLGLKSFYMPVSLAYINAFTPNISGILGLEYRAGFDRALMPLLGVAARVSDTVRLEAQVPESRLTYFFRPGWSTHLGFAWQNVSYTVEDRSELGRDQITLEDFRAFWGIGRRWTDELQFMGELGWVFDRDVEFEQISTDFNREVDVDSALLIRFALVGPL